jgi:mycothiol system anti-sigma-R factor
MSHDVSLNQPGLPCAEWEERLGAYLDDELDASSRASVERHLEACAGCRARYERQRALRDALHTLPVHAAPDLLRARILGAVRTSADRESPVATPSAPAMDATATAAALRRWRWAALAASALFVVSTTYGVIATRNATGRATLTDDSATEAIAHDVLASHVRSLMPGHLTDVASTNRHNVKPWFNGRLDYSPPVYDLSADGFPLAGGRVDYVDGRAVAVLVYERRQHVISLYVWPAGRAGMPAAEQLSGRTRQGYHMLAWTRGGMTRWAISDLNLDELHQFAGLEQRSDSLAAAPTGAGQVDSR